jgi:hypothetical protein
MVIPLLLRSKTFIIIAGGLLLVAGATLTRNQLKAHNVDLPQLPALLNKKTDVKELGPADTKDSSQAVNNSNSTNITVNGQHIGVPPNGEVHENIPIEDGEVTIDVSNESNSSGTANSNSSTNININSNSSN